MVNFWKNASIMAIAEIFLKLKAIILLPFITRYFGAISYGVWSQVMIVVSLLTPLVYLGMENSLVRYLPGLPSKEQRADFTGWFLFGLATSSVLFFSVVFLNHFIAENFFGSANEYGQFVLLAGLNILTTALLNGFRYWYRIQQQAKTLVWLTVVQNLGQMLVLIGILLAHLQIYHLVLGSVVFDLLLIAVCSLRFIQSEIFIKPSFTWLKKYFRFGIVLLPSGYAVWILNSLDRVFLVNYQTMADIGVYSICFTIGYTVIQVFVNPVWSLFPAQAAEYYNQGKPSALQLLLNQSIKFIFWITFPSIAGFIAVGNECMQLLTTDDFALGYLAVPIILSGYFFSMISSYFETVLGLCNKPYFSTIFTIIAATANVILNFLLIPKYSYMGAAVATSLSFLLQLALSTLFMYREKIIAVEWWPLLKIFVISVVMYFMVWGLKTQLMHTNNFTVLMACATTGCMLYLLLTHMAHIYQWKDIKRIYRVGSL